jgi:hypothetical protein
VSLGPDGFDAIVGIDPPILVSRRAAKTYAVRVGGRPMTLSLPLRGPDALSMDEGQTWRPIPDFPPSPLAEQLTSGVHMRLKSSAKLPDKPLIVEAVRLRWRDRRMTRKVQTETFWGLEEDFGGWLALVRDWLNAWMGGVRERLGASAHPQPKATRLIAAAPDIPNRLQTRRNSPPPAGGMGLSLVYCRSAEAKRSQFSGVPHGTRLIFDLLADHDGISHYLSLTRRVHEVAAGGLRAAIPSLRLDVDQRPKALHGSRPRWQTSGPLAVIRRRPGRYLGCAHRQPVPAVHRRGSLAVVVPKANGSPCAADEP